MTRLNAPPAKKSPAVAVIFCDPFWRGLSLGGLHSFFIDSSTKSRQANFAWGSIGWGGKELSGIDARPPIKWVSAFEYGSALYFPPPSFLLGGVVCGWIDTLHCVAVAYLMALVYNGGTDQELGV